jgi:RNA polymerase sigma-70 factor (ECF subfamily)
VAPAGRQRVEHYLRRLYGYAFSLTHEPDAAQELLHETVVKALAAKTVPGDEPAYRAWLFRILRNAFIDRYRRQRELDRAVVPGGDEDGMWAHGSETQEVNALAVRLAFRQLPVNHREILGLIDVSGLTYTEAADLLQVPVGTVMSRISRARAALYNAMAETRSDQTIEFLPARRMNGKGGRR